jgi:hypothetical protein
MQFRSLKISNYSEKSFVGIIMAHGGYTPKRNFLQTGSGKIIIPKDITINFYTNHDNFSIGGRGVNLYLPRQNNPPPPIIETLIEGMEIENYSLAHNSNFDRLDEQSNSHITLIRILPNSKAHLKDVFDFCKIHKIKVLHYFACRVNKLDCELNISGP